MAIDYKNFAIIYENGIDDMVSKLDASGIFDGETLRLQADCHVGKGCAVGTCLTYMDKIVPSLVGCDIACRVSAYSLGKSSIDMSALDSAIYKRVPSGFSVRDEEHEFSREFPYKELRCWGAVREKEGRFRKSLGTLGGGNHFIAVEQGQLSEENYLMIHCGTRNFGKVVFDHYQARAIRHRDEIARDLRTEYELDIQIARAEGRVKDISGIIDFRNAAVSTLPDNDLAYLEGQDMEDYLHDMELLEKWSHLNHQAIAGEICGALGIEAREVATSIHNYVDTEHGIIRKGAIAAYEGQTGIIPMNMRDGSLLVRGKGNEDYLWSAPHGAGRIMSRAQAKRDIDLGHYIDEMAGIYTTSVSVHTLDEAPDAYKKMEDILPAIAPTVEVTERTIPVYNYKAQ